MLARTLCAFFSFLYNREIHDLRQTRAESRRTLSKTKVSTFVGNFSRCDKEAICIQFNSIILLPPNPSLIPLLSPLHDDRARKKKLTKTIVLIKLDFLSEYESSKRFRKWKICRVTIIKHICFSPQTLSCRVNWEAFNIYEEEKGSRKSSKTFLQMDSRDLGWVGVS